MLELPLLVVLAGWSTVAPAPGDLGTGRAARLLAAEEGVAVPGPTAAGASAPLEPLRAPGLEPSKLEPGSVEALLERRTELLDHRPELGKPVVLLLGGAAVGGLSAFLLTQSIPPLFGRSAEASPGVSAAGAGLMFAGGLVTALGSLALGIAGGVSLGTRLAERVELERQAKVLEAQLRELGVPVRR